MENRAFVIGFSISLGVHLLLVVGQLFSLNWLTAPNTRGPLEVVYEYQIAERELRRLQDKLSRALGDAAAPAPSPDALSERLQIRVPDRPALAMDQTVSHLGPTRGAIVDLTNLVEAARGDPVLLSYFSAIREQIQQTANRRAWLTGEAAQGLVYISFLLTSSGAVKSVGIVEERSSASDALRDIALRIVKNSSPFPPFPPSMIEPNKTIIVPLEFLLEH